MGNVIFFKSNYNCNGDISIIEPSTYKNFWNNKTFDKLQLLFDINKIYEDKFKLNIIGTEFLIKNDSIYSELILTIIDNDIEILNVTLQPNEAQKYLLGISDGIKVFVQGSFTASLYISTY